MGFLRKVFGGLEDLFRGPKAPAKPKKSKSLKEINKQKTDITTSRDDIIRRSLASQSSTALTGAGFIARQQAGPQDSQAAPGIVNLSRQRKGKSKSSRTDLSFTESLEFVLDDSPPPINPQDALGPQDNELSGAELVEATKKKRFFDEEEDEILGITTAGAGFGNAFESLVGG